MADLTFPELQQKMQLEKEQKQGVKYPFRTAEDIYNKFKKLDSGWSVSFPEDDIQVIKDKIYYKAVAVARRESDGIEQKAVGWAREEDVPVFHTQKGDVKQMQDPQWTGAVGSYARKYALQGLFAIGGEDVDEHPVEENQQAPQGSQQGQANQPPQQEQAQYITNEQYTEIVGWIRSLAQALNKPFDEVEQGYLKHYQITDFHQVPIEYFDTVVSRLKSQVDKYNQPQNDFNSL
ncbi:ERF family protein [Streptococcus suis]